MISNIFLAIVCFLPSTLAEFPLVPDPFIIDVRDDGGEYRLPTDTVPISYDITLEPHFDPDFTFDGQVTIVIRVEEATNRITLHSNEISFAAEDVEASEQNGVSPIEVVGVEFVEEYHFVEISLDETLEPGTILEVSIKYTGILSSTNRGFYRASYDEGGVTKWFGTTQFEPTYARQAFPCYDEPALKATFTIHIIRPATYNSISNMLLVNTEPLDDDRLLDTFEESVIMSTYLVAFIVSEMEYEAESNQAVYGVPELIRDGRGVYPLQTSIATLNALEQYTSVPYSINKLYQAAIPNDWFSSGAMENWGLVTYRERYLLYKDGITTSAEKQTIAYIISHELAHQWFGNIVSPSWWSYIWLNEGFATYFEYYTTNEVDPDMRMMDQIVVRAHQYAMESDALRTTRAMTTDAQTPGQISGLFDRVAYDKSGSVLRMVENFLTEEIFKSGLTTYLNNMAFDAATADDLWDGLQAAVDQINPTILEDLTVKDIMDTWELQAGFPVVNVQRNSNGEIVLSQSRFLLNEATHEFDTVWTIPISIATASDPDFTDTTPSYWLKEASENTGITVNDDEWVIINKQEAGYYRVNYDDESWNLIIDHLKSDDFDEIHLLNRAQLIDDSMNLARSGRLSYSTVMNLLQYLSKEVDYIPLYSFFRGLSFINRQLVNTAYYEEFKTFVKEILQTAYDSLGVEDTGLHTEKLNRISVLTWLCRFGHEDCVSQMHDKLAAGEAAPPDLQSLVYCSGLISDTDLDAKFDYLLARYAGDEAEYLEKSRIVSALGCTVSVEHLNRLLDIVVDQDASATIASSDKASVVSGIYSNSKIGLETTFDYLLNNFENVQNSLTTSQIMSIFSGISERLTSNEQKTRLEEFIESLPDETQALYSSTFTNALNNIQTNMVWIEGNAESITGWLEAYYDTDDETDPPVTEDPEPTPPVTEDPEPTPPVTEDPEPTPPVTEDPEPTPPVTEDPEPTPPATEEPEATTPDDDVTTTEDPDGSLVFTVSIPLLIFALCLQTLT